jgi:hypothetical protein
MSNSEIYLQNDSPDSWSPLSFSYINSKLDSVATINRRATGGDFTSAPAVLYGVQASITGNASKGESIKINNGSSTMIQFIIPDSGAANFDFTPSVGMDFNEKISLTTTVGSQQGLSVSVVFK